MKKIFSILACLLIITQALYARKDIYSSNLVSGNAWVNGLGQPIILNSSVTNGKSSVFGTHINYKNISLKSYVKFFLNTETIPPLLGAFTATITVNITYYLEGTTPNIPHSMIKTLQVDYSPVSGAKYKNVDIALIDDAYKFEVSFSSNALIINNGSPSQIQKDFISIQTFTEHERVYNYLDIFNNPGSNTTSYTPPILTSYNSNDNELTLSWISPFPVEEGYELEYTFVDDYGDINSTAGFVTAGQLTFSFKNNSTRILLTNNQFTIPMVMEHGYLLYRIRGYGMAGSNLDRLFFGTFPNNTGGNNPDQVFNVLSYPYKFKIAGNLVHAGDQMNWQSVTTFAEEGKSKTVVKYMDGTMRTRQTVTSTSTEKNTIVAETIYDRQGRPAINILPAPVDLPAIKYYANFNRNQQGQPYGYSDFDILNPNGCGDFNIGPLSKNSGAGNYYSSSNPNKTAFNAFIPDANGYPFTRVTYMPDATDRVVRQGNVGEVFQPGNTANNTYQKHDTKYFYAKPDQPKLDYLFGTNVGYAQFYQKNMVVDPNGQVSVSYVDLDGKTIATALAGETPESLDPLRSNASASFTVDLISGTDMVNEQDHSITNSQAFTVSGNGALYKFNYALNKNTYQALSCSGKNYCLDCIYDLEITLIKDECGEIKYQNKTTVGNLTNLNFLCLDAGAEIVIPFDVTLDVGSYTITKKLTVNKEVAEKYADSILNDPNNTCLKTFDDFYNEAWNNRDTNRCKEACDACMAESNAAETAALIAKAAKACDSLWCHPQMATQCDIARMSMINDLRPGGQYAVYKDDNGNINLGYSPVSVFNVNNVSFKAIQLADPATIQNIPVNLPGQPTRTLINYLSSGALAQQLFNNWPDDLSGKLLSLHPEYCYLKYCNLPFVQAGNDFDTKLMNAKTFAEAQTIFGATNVSGTGINNFYAFDYYYAQMVAPPSSPNMNVSAIQSGIQAKFLDFTGAGQNHTIKKMALFLANCPSGNDINNCAATWGDGINDDAEWQKFVALYFTIKQEYTQRARDEYVLNATGCCPNNYIGCGTGNNVCPPPIWNNNFTHIIPTACNNNNNYYYASATKRFTTINDIDFPGVGDPTESIYNMTPQEQANYIQSDSLKSPCPTCPELDAFKMMIWHIQSQKWIHNGAYISPDAVIGLTGALRQRLFGSMINPVVVINQNSIFFGTPANNVGCRISFNADTAINWQTAEIFPTCLEIQDYRHAKLHIMVDGAYKTVLNFTSTCDVFYCDGKAPEPPKVNNDCKCDSVYSNIKWYNLGDIVKYNDQCYIVSKVMKNGKLSPETPPGTKGWWQKLCDVKPEEKCTDPFIIDFETPAVFVTSLGLSSTSPAAVNRYTIQQYYPVNNTSLPSKAMVTHPGVNSQIIFEKTAAVIAGRQYKISFDARVIIDRTMQLQLKINNQPINTYSLNWQNPQSLSVIWNSNNSSSVKITILCVQVRSDKLDEIAIDNIKMLCIGNGISSGAGGDTTATSSSRYIPQSVCGCNGLCDANLPSPEMPYISCDSIQKDIATQQAAEAFASYRDSVFNAILNGYYAKCMQSIETFSMDYNDAEYHYTLYYYDQSGNLVQTVPPTGVKPFTTQAELNAVTASRNSINGAPFVPPHIMPTTYRHNSLNAVVWQKTPDAGESEFFYDDLGRIAISQNAQQKIPVAGNSKASYTTYDKLGRTVEVGVLDHLALTTTSANLKSFAADYINWSSIISITSRSEITKTFYDKAFLPKIDIAFGSNLQQNLRNRIGTVAYFAKHTDLPLNDYQHATHYSYDIAGNVTDLLQDFGTASDFGTNPNNIKTQSRHINYQFDLVSGKVNQVNYQPGNADQFFYRYEYNADNKLTKVFTSTNGLVWENDARYFYYRHGPFARTEYGTDHVQGIDMAYTLQGWIKGANGNATDPGADIGQDGDNGNTTPTGYQAQNINTAPDVFSYWLGYHKDDYTAIANGQTYIPAAINSLQTGPYHTTAANLYNGNIRSMYTNLQPFGGLGMHYKYDQLNRIKKQEAFDFSTGTLIANNAYTMQLEFNPNGNIQRLLRNGTVTTPAMDDLKYVYYNANGTSYTGDPAATDATNKLAYVMDAVGNTTEPTDIEDQPVNNYDYDAIGNLIKDSQEGLSIEWNVQNKITEIKKPGGKDILYNYDALGNRIKKTVMSGNAGISGTTQYYVRDAQGNTLAIYEMKNDDLHWAEQHIYGSSRLGIYKPAVNFNMPQRGIFTTRNSTQYELTNHLGNVLATVSDAKSIVAGNSAATLLTATDYYAFGMAMPDRKYALNNVKFRYGFNGKENEDETSTQDYGFRIYNPALCKFLSVDPLTEKYPELTPYQFASNTPMQSIDLDGLEENNKTKPDAPRQNSGNNKNEAKGMCNEKIKENKKESYVEVLQKSFTLVNQNVFNDNKKKENEQLKKDEVAKSKLPEKYSNSKIKYKAKYFVQSMEDYKRNEKFFNPSQEQVDAENNLKVKSVLINQFGPYVGGFFNYMRPGGAFEQAIQKMGPLPNSPLSAPQAVKIYSKNTILTNSYEWSFE